MTTPSRRSSGCRQVPCRRIRAELHEWPRQGEPVSDVLLEAARVLQATYLVAGAYGHTRFRETVLGGVTRELIQTSTIPLFLAH